MFWRNKQLDPKYVRLRYIEEICRLRRLLKSLAKNGLVRIWEEDAILVSINELAHRLNEQSYRAEYKQLVRKRDEGKISEEDFKRHPAVWIVEELPQLRFGQQQWDASQTLGFKSLRSEYEHFYKDYGVDQRQFLNHLYCHYSKKPHIRLYLNQFNNSDHPGVGTLTSLEPIAQSATR